MHDSHILRKTSALLTSLGASMLLGGCSLLTELDTLSGGDGVQSTDAEQRASGGAGGAAQAGGAGGGGQATAVGGGGSDDAAAGGSATTSSSAGGAATCNPTGVDYDALVINEIAPDGDPLDWIELANRSSEPIWLCNVFITQHYAGGTPPSGADRYTFADVYLGPLDRIVLQTEVDFLFGLSKAEPERVTVFDPDGAMIDDTEWSADATTAFSEAESWARVPDMTGDFIRTAPTKGGPNPIEP